MIDGYRNNERFAQICKQYEGFPQLILVQPTLLRSALSNIGGHISCNKLRNPNLTAIQSTQVGNMKLWQTRFHKTVLNL